LVGVKRNLTADFRIIKEMGNGSDKSEVVQIDVWNLSFTSLLLKKVDSLIICKNVEPGYGIFLLKVIFFPCLF
jgi:hypothetical protein